MSFRRFLWVFFGKFWVLACDAQFKCPQKTGYFPDAVQCDLYYQCSKGNFEEKLCPDGLVFDDTDPNHERCDIPANIDCGDRTELRKYQFI